MPKINTILGKLFANRQTGVALAMALGLTLTYNTFAAGTTPAGSPGVVNDQGAPDQANGQVVNTVPRTQEQLVRNATQAEGKPLADVNVGSVRTKAIANEVLVEVPDRQAAARLGPRLRPTGVPGSYLLSVNPGVPLAQAKQQAERLPGVAHVDYNAVAVPFGPTVTPNDRLFQKGQQWNLDKISAPQGWSRTQGSPNVVVAVIDTGFNYNHPDLKDKAWHNRGEIPGNGIDDDNNGYIDDSIGMDFASSVPVGAKLANDADGPMDIPYQGQYNYVSGHGTAVGSVIAGETNNQIGVAGINWNAKIMPLRVCDPLCSWESVARAIYYATDNGAKVINMSLGGQSPNVAIVDKALEYANGKGVVVVIASGNDSASTVAYPGRYPTAIAVGAVNANDNKKPYSNAGPEVAVVAPSGITTAYYAGNKYQRGIEGTSFSSPEVAGLASLIVSYNPDLSPQAVKDIIIYSADKVPGMNGQPKTDLYGYGRININRALDFVGAERVFGNSSTNKVKKVGKDKQKKKDKAEKKKQKEKEKQQKKVEKQQEKTHKQEQKKPDNKKKK